MRKIAWPRNYCMMCLLDLNVVFPESLVLCHIVCLFMSSDQQKRDAVTRTEAENQLSRLDLNYEAQLRELWISMWVSVVIDREQCME